MVTGLLWGWVGIIFSTAITKKFDFYAFMLISSLFNVIGAWVLIPDYAAVAAGNLSSIALLVMIMAGVALLGSAGFLIMRNAMNNGGHHGIIWAIAQSAMVIPFIAGSVNQFIFFYVLALCRYH